MMRVKFKRAPLQRPATPPSPRTVVVSDGVLNGLANNKEVLRRCPWLKVNIPQVKGCKCGRNRVQRTADVKEFGRVRQNLVNAPKEAIAYVKSLLHADILIVYTNAPSGTVKNNL